MRNEKGKKMKYEKVEKWMDVAMLVVFIGESVMCAFVGRFSEMFAWACAAMWVYIAAMRRSTRDVLYRRWLKAIGRPKEGEVAE